MKKRNCCPWKRAVQFLFLRFGKSCAADMGGAMDFLPQGCQQVIPGGGIHNSVRRQRGIVLKLPDGVLGCGIIGAAAGYRRNLRKGGTECLQDPLNEENRTAGIPRGIGRNTSGEGRQVHCRRPDILQIGLRQCIPGLGISFAGFREMVLLLKLPDSFGGLNAVDSVRNSSW